MNLSNKTFRNNKTGEVVKIIDSFENIAILEGKGKADVRDLINPEIYTEQINPSDFFSNQNAYNSLAEKIKNIPEDKIIEDGETSVNFVDGQARPANNDSAVIMTTEEEERAELAKKYGIINPSEGISKQNEAFAKLLNEDELEVEKIEVSREVNTNGEEVYKSTAKKLEDPIITMFKNVKRNKDFSITIEISNKIPRIDFIELMEDSYETSIIDFLAEEFTNNLLKNPNTIESMIKEKIKDLVYNKPKQVSKKPPSSQKNKTIKNKSVDAVATMGKLFESMANGQNNDDAIENSKKEISKKPTPPLSQSIKEGKDPKPVSLKKEISK